MSSAPHVRMHEQDRMILARMVNGEDFSDNLLERYARYQRAWHRVQTGPLPTDALLVIAAETDVEIPEPPKSRWDSIPIGTDVEFLYSGDWVKGTFQGVLHGPLQGQLDIAVYGDLDLKRPVMMENVRLPGEQPSEQVPEKLPLPASEEFGGTLPNPPDDVEPEPPAEATAKPEPKPDDPPPKEAAVKPETSKPEPPEEKAPRKCIFLNTPIGTRMMVSTDDGVREGALFRVPRPNSQHAGLVYIAFEGDDKQYRMFDQEDVQIAPNTDADELVEETEVQDESQTALV